MTRFGFWVLFCVALCLVGPSWGSLSSDEGQGRLKRQRVVPRTLGHRIVIEVPTLTKKAKKPTKQLVVHPFDYPALTNFKAGDSLSASKLYRLPLELRVYLLRDLLDSVPALLALAQTDVGHYQFVRDYLPLLYPPDVMGRELEQVIEVMAGRPNTETFLRCTQDGRQVLRYYGTFRNALQTNYFAWLRQRPPENRLFGQSYREYIEKTHNTLAPLPQGAMAAVSHKNLLLGALPDMTSPLIQKLCVTDAHILFTNDVLQKMTGLTSLDLSNNLLNKIDLRSLVSLTNVNLTRNKMQFVHLPKSVQYVDLSYNCLESIDTTNCPELRSLYARVNKLTTIEIGKVEDLNLAANQLQVLDLRKVPNLRSVNLNINKLVKIQLSELPNLTRLFVSDNFLKDESIVAVDVPKLSILQAFNNQFEYPCFYNQFPGLSVLGLTQRIFHVGPDWFPMQLKGYGIHDCHFCDEMTWPYLLQMGGLRELTLYLVDENGDIEKIIKGINRPKMPLQLGDQLNKFLKWRASILPDKPLVINYGAGVKIFEGAPGTFLGSPPFNGQIKEDAPPHE